MCAQRTDGQREKLGNFVYEYLQRRFGLEQMVVEWAYNLHDACQRYAHDDNIGLFWNVLTEEVGACVGYLWDVCLCLCICIMYREEVQKNGHNITGTIFSCKSHKG